MGISVRDVFRRKCRAAILGSAGGILEEQMWTRKANTESLRRLKRNFWQRVHHVVGHSLVGLSNGQLWAWAFHDWSWRKAWPESDEPLPQRWKGLE